MPTVAENYRAVLTVHEVASRLRVSLPTVYRRIAEGVIPAFRVGTDYGPLRIFEDELEQSLRRVATSPNPAERDGAPDLPAVEARATGGEEAQT